MHTSSHTADLVALAQETPAFAEASRSLAAGVLTALKDIDAHITEVRDLASLAALSETDEAAAVALGRLPPFINGVVAEVAILRVSAVRLATIAKELAATMPLVTETALKEAVPAEPVQNDPPVVP